MTTLHLSAKGLQRTELKLLDCPFSLVQPCGNFPDGALLNESLANHLALNRGKLIDETKKAGVVIDGFQIGRRKVWVLVGVICIA